MNTFRGLINAIILQLAALAFVLGCVAHWEYFFGVGVVVLLWVVKEDNNG